MYDLDFHSQKALALLQRAKVFLSFLLLVSDCCSNSLFSSSTTGTFTPLQACNGKKLGVTRIKLNKKSSLLRAGLSYGALSAGSDIASQLLCEKRELKYLSVLQDHPENAKLLLGCNADTPAVALAPQLSLPVSTSTRDEGRARAAGASTGATAKSSRLAQVTGAGGLPALKDGQPSPGCAPVPSTSFGTVYRTNYSRVLPTNPCFLVSHKGRGKGKSKSKSYVECESKQIKQADHLVWAPQRSTDIMMRPVDCSSSTLTTASASATTKMPLEDVLSTPAVVCATVPAKNTLITPEKELDLARTLRWGFVGASLTGPYYRVAYEVVERFWKSEIVFGTNNLLKYGKLQLVLKNLSQQFLVNPVFLAIFFTYSSIVEDFCTNGNANAGQEGSRAKSSATGTTAPDHTTFDAALLLDHEFPFHLTDACKSKIDEKLSNQWPEACKKSIVFWGFVDLITYQLPMKNRVYFASACGALWTTFLSFLDNGKKADGMEEFSSRSSADREQLQQISDGEFWPEEQEQLLGLGGETLYAVRAREEPDFTSKPFLKTNSVVGFGKGSKWDELLLRGLDVSEDGAQNQPSSPILSPANSASSSSTIGTDELALAAKSNRFWLDEDE
ncbi:unnamed protein product [Amoebophrya sp. A120]|nr:unnamed protein product [Amoebophrya sp. A120]|eukprot:GSA120T00022383001.1